MYAVIRTGGKQRRVKKGQIVDVELLEPKEGEIEFSDVLFLQNGEESHVGTPRVEGCVVKANVLGVVKGPKIRSVKYKRRKQQYRTFGHRQRYTRVEITDIVS